MILGVKVPVMSDAVPARLVTLAACWLGLSLIAVPAHAQQAGTMNFISFCGAVEAKVLENHPTRDEVLYRYQTMVYAAAGVTPEDSLQVAYEKTRVFMDANQTSLTCNTINFNPRDGNIYKIAVARQVNGFIDDALNNWHVDLNQIDATDGKTVLDYIADRRATAGPTYARILDRYYARFRAAGARHARELHRPDGS